MKKVRILETFRHGDSFFKAGAIYSLTDYEAIYFEGQGLIEILTVPENRTLK